MEFYYPGSYSQKWFQFSWFRTFLFLFLFTIFSTTSVSSSTAPKISYSVHCASFIPESTSAVAGNSTYPFLRTAITYFSGGERILGRISPDRFLNFSDETLSFSTRIMYKTNVSGVYWIVANLIFLSSNMYYIPSNSRNGFSYHHRNRSGVDSLRFRLNGFYSESSGKLCATGSPLRYFRNGKSVKLEAVLKLNYAKNQTIFTSLIGGKLNSLSSPNDPNYFDPISILTFSQTTQYDYTLVSKEFDEGCPGGIDIPQTQSLSLQPRRICSILSRPYNTFYLEYVRDCKSLKDCTPFGGVIGFLPRLLSLYAIQCSEDEPKFRFLIRFPARNYDAYSYSQSFHPNTTLVGEGSWDEKKNRLCIVACRILNPMGSKRSAQVGDCSIRLSLSYPAIWTIRNSSTIIGQIWTNKTVKDSGYFERIVFRGSENIIEKLPGLKYEYTETERVRPSCRVEKVVKKNKGESYPDGHSYDMRFDMSVKDSKGKSTWGYAVPIAVGDQFYERGLQTMSASAPANEGWAIPEEAQVIPEAVEKNSSFRSPLNISYRISFTPFVGDGFSSFNLSLRPDGPVEITAEGVYDGETGRLCMVGCRKLGSFIQNSTNEAVDCEILLSIQFPPLNSRNGDSIKGKIESTRKKTDPLYFEHFSMSSTSFYLEQAQQSIWRMDLEITMVLISNTLACLFVILQLFYVKKNPDVLPYVSLLMLVILTLGYMIPLVLNFEALFSKNPNRQNVDFGSGGWLEVNEVLVRVVTMVAFLLQFRLLQLAWSAQFGGGNEKGQWIAEMRALLVSLPLYIVGGLIALFVNFNQNKYSSTVYVFSNGVYQQPSLWRDLRSYGGLVLDGFLFPQILLNIFSGSSESALSRSFYIGTTFVRLLPHGYDLYRAHNYAQRHFYGAYIYANPSADFYSAAWDVIIPCGGILFSVIIFLQQRFGGRCVLPRRFRGLAVYEKVPVVATDQ
ncbi:unnamed protein product [Ilex paraguariensis]|uniref:RING-type E3 ubiquitin transferase n=1 Tax=Ilex paraguariensis TaxID=185542 RepID=A0ABC8UPM8_9AQUA